MRSRENPIRKTTTKGGNYRPTKSGAGMTKKGVAAYRRANPGSKLKKGSKDAKRRASFCARMTGMRKRQKPSNNTGDDRLSKSLRKWNC